jgi:putative peptide zinc metalloprotease protein
MPTLFSQYWYRIAPLRPRLRSHVEIHRHHYRGKLWYVLQNHSSQRQHRFSPAAYAFIGLIDGQRTVEEIYQLAEANLGDQAPTQNEVAQVLAQLHAADAMQCDVPPDIGELLLRHERQSRQQWRNRLWNPLSASFPLFDPEQVLVRLLPLVRPLQSQSGAILWLTVVGMAALQAAVHWSELTHDVTDRILTPQNIFILWLVFPLVKILHELGHGLATKIYGGEVHEMGVLLVALQPIPYVDASAASAFRFKRQRILVGAAGMIVELFIASLALFLWLNVQPGLVRAMAYNVMFIAGVSTVLFNANPLLRYDGYYMLADYLEMPNLRTRAQAYMGYLCERYLFGRQDAVSEPATAVERVWLTVYPIAAFIYRLFVLAAIALFLAGKFFFIGVLLALAGVAAWALVPLVKAIAYLCTSPRIHSVRRRALAASALTAVALLGALLWLPLPLRTRAEGVIWIPEHARLRAGADGFVERIVARPGSRVRPGEILIVCRDPQLTTRVKVLEARLDELDTRYMAQWLTDVRQAQIIKDEISHVQEQLARARERVADLVILSRAEGVFEVPDAASLPGRFVRQGASLGYVLDLNALTARVVVSDAEVELVRHRTRQIELRLVDRPSQTFTTVVQREVPAASEKLPSMALGSQGGGTIAVDPLDKDGVKSIEKVFQFDLALPASAGIRAFGGRVYVRFDHGWEPIASRWHRQLRQLFLSRFHV